jgi:hypothetical protein
MNAQLTSVAEGGNTGQRLTISNSSNHGDIGDKAVNLSFSGSSSLTNGVQQENILYQWERRTIASGINSTAMGYSTTASAESSTAMGRGTTASGTRSTAMGYNTTASGAYSTAMGYYTTAGGDYSTASGSYSTASGSYSTAMGHSTTASGIASTSMGDTTTASGLVSTAMGIGTTASDFASTVIGLHNSSGSLATSAGSFSTSNTAFVIGNGADSSNKSDAFKVMFNGDTTVSNDLTVSGDVVVSSDARLKSNIVSLGSTLSRLLLIDGKSYEMKGKQKIGVLAQEIQEVFPELVSEDENEMLAVNYQGLVPVLINALKEQDAEMKEQEKRLERLEAIISKMDK